MQLLELNLHIFCIDARPLNGVYQLRLTWQNSCIAVANNLEEYDANTVQNVSIKNDSVFQWFLPSIKKHKKQFLSVIFISIMIQLYFRS
jgi:ABC-type bacteriocin/lantibiotic exporter with double-glycine peptidase domain